MDDARHKPTANSPHSVEVKSIERDILLKLLTSSWMNLFSMEARMMIQMMFWMGFQMMVRMASPMVFGRMLSIC